MIVLLVTFLASFLFVFLKAFQQRNVTGDHYIAVLPTSLLMATAEVFVISNIATHGYSLGLVVTIGTGSGLGAIVAMVIHRKLFNRRNTDGRK